jgi:uncharacterized protein YchJ
MHRLFQEDAMGRNTPRRNQRGRSTSGTINVQQSGRFTLVDAKWNIAAFEQMRKNLPRRREEIRREMSSEVAALVHVINQCDPLPLIVGLFTKNSVVDPEKYEEPTHEGSEARAEYAQSLALAVGNWGSTPATNEEGDRFETGIQKILDLAWTYFAMREHKPGALMAIEETKFLGMMRHLFVRGSSFLEHDTDLIRALFGPHSEFFRRHHLFTADELIRFCDEVAASVNATIKELAESLLEVKKSHEKFRALADAHPDKPLEDLLEMLREDPETREAFARMRLAMESHSHMVRVTDENPVWCEQLALAPGDNAEFLTFAKSPGWPSNNSRVYIKPLVLREGKYYCPNPVLLLRNRARILEQAIRDRDPTYYQDRYASVRGKVVESLALCHFRRLLPGAQVQSNLYYGRTVDGAYQRFETDGLVICDSFLLILEMKAGPFSDAALRGADRALASDLNHLIGEPYEQAIRTLNYLKSGEEVVFEAPDRTEVLRVRAGDFRRVFLVNVTLSDIGHVAGRLNSAKAMGLIEGREWPWSVFINDLRVISEIMESSAEFLLFLERRLVINELESVSTIDELDYLGLFLKDGLYFENDRASMKRLTRFAPIGYTVPIERYYEAQAGRIDPVEKPRLNTSPWILTLASAIQGLSKRDALYAAKVLLSLDGRQHEKIDAWAKQYDAVCERDHKAHTLTLLARGCVPIVFCITADSDAQQLAEQESYCELKVIQTGADELLGVFVEGYALRTVGFKMFTRAAACDPTLAQRLHHRSHAMVARHIQQHGTPGRNAQCPCNSGRKYKRCCGR